MTRVFKETVQRRKEKQQRETEADARILGWILVLDGSTGSTLKRSEGGSWRCIWAELEETCRGRIKKEERDRDATKDARTLGLIH